jgi:hypothetical protein
LLLEQVSGSDCLLNVGFANGGLESHQRYRFFLECSRDPLAGLLGSSISLCPKEPRKVRRTRS